MSEPITERLQLNLILANQAQKHLSLNASLLRLEALVQAQVNSRTRLIAPSAPLASESYILPAGALSGPWSGFGADERVIYLADHWQGVEMPLGAMVYVADEARFVVKTEAGWRPLEALCHGFDQLGHIGIGTEADGFNRLAVKSEGVLLSAPDQGPDNVPDHLSLSLNRREDQGFAQILFQTAYETEFVLGLMPEGGLSLKSPSPFGQGRTLIHIDGVSGQVEFSEPQRPRANLAQARWVKQRPLQKQGDIATAFKHPDAKLRASAYMPSWGAYGLGLTSPLGAQFLCSEDGVSWQAAFGAPASSLSGFDLSPKGRVILAGAFSLAGHDYGGVMSADLSHWQPLEVFAQKPLSVIAHSPQAGLWLAAEAGASTVFWQAQEGPGSGSGSGSGLAEGFAPLAGPLGLRCLGLKWVKAWGAFMAIGCDNAQRLKLWRYDAKGWSLVLTGQVLAEGEALIDFTVFEASRQGPFGGRGILWLKGASGVVSWMSDNGQDWQEGPQLTGFDLQPKGCVFVPELGQGVVYGQALGAGPMSLVWSGEGQDWSTGPSLDPQMTNLVSGLWSPDHGRLGLIQRNPDGALSFWHSASRFGLGLT